ncbi:MAG TPA: dihydrolipoamide acetyltransferase family protein [Xanthobacteraceae bacterium]|jgi:pyruvate dehydrogenase E2 component (dihydrolipoamide acetyltransferase)|nr:dihydrolipoamide acetyltransferase family protein [Xanthobacteraceae bacterium]
MDVLMPQLGETVAEGKITKWFKSAGDAVKPGDNLFEIETDKVSMEVPSTTTGTLAEIRVVAGEVAPVGAIVGVIADGTGASASAPAAATPKAPAAKPAAPAAPLVAAAPVPAAQPRQPAQPLKLDPFFEVRTPDRNFGPAKLAGGVAITPLARRLAGEAGIDLSRIRGSGPHGRIVARDVEDAPRPSRTPAAYEGPSAAELKALYAPDSYEEVPLDGMRKTIAARLTQAVAVPHFYLMTDVVIDRLLALREEANAAAPKDKDGNPAFKISLNDFAVRALALALQRVPAANAIWAGDRILRFKHSDIGVAVALEGGLITPVIRNAETKSLSAISAEVKDLSSRARNKKLQPSEYQGGSSAISNLGMHNVREFTAIINPPHASILAVGAARRQAVEKDDGGVAFASMISITLSCDHRVLDGALGAELLAAIKTLVEQPVSLLV